MGKINYGRVIVGGLLAGVVITIGEFIVSGLILGDQWEAFMTERGLPTESTSVMVMYIAVNFIYGFSIVWLYAGIRPRFGAGPKTAVMAGFFVWFVSWFLGFGAASVSFLIPAGLVLTSLVWGIVELCLAAVAGAWAYQEVSLEAGPAQAASSEPAPSEMASTSGE